MAPPAAAARAVASGETPKVIAVVPTVPVDAAVQIQKVPPFAVPDCTARVAPGICAHKAKSAARVGAPEAFAV